MDELISRISELFMKYGVKSIVMDDIARELGISKKTLYCHFENKTDILTKVVHSVLVSEFSDLDKLISENPNAIDQFLSIAYNTVSNLLKFNPILPYELHKNYPQVWSKLISERRELIQSRIKQNFHLGIEQGLYRNNLNDDILAVYYSNFLVINSIEFFAGELNEDYYTVFRTLSIISLRGIATSMGMTYIEKIFNNELVK